MTCAVPRNFLKKLSQTVNATGNPSQMNIFATSESPQTCARNLDTMTLHTQIVCVAVMLSRYAKMCSYPYNQLYKEIEPNHPFMRWLFNHEANIDWLKEYGVILQVEYANRTSLAHAGRQDLFEFINDFRPSVGLEPIAFLNRAWDDLFDYSDIQNVHQAYRDLLCARWTTAKIKPSWGDRLPPHWYIENLATREGNPHIQNRLKQIGELDNGGKRMSFTITESKGGRSRVSYTEGLSGGCEVH